MSEAYPTSSTRLKPHLKNIRIVLTSLGLKDVGGDKRAYFISELNDMLSRKYIAKYGANYSSILVFEKDNISPIFQRKLGHNFAMYVKSDVVEIREFRLRVPEHILYNANTQLHVLVIRCVPDALLVTPNIDLAIAKLSEHHNRLIFENKDTGMLEVYQVREKHVSGARFKGGL